MYNLLEEKLPDDLEINLLDAVDYVIENMQGDDLMSVLAMVYSPKALKDINGMDALLLLVRCFKVNEFFLFVEFVRSTKW